MGFLKSLFAITIVGMLSGCEKAVDFNLRSNAPKLVVEAVIEADEAPHVVLTTSFDYFSTISPDLLSKSFVHNAQIEISNGTKTHRLKEYEVPVGLGYSLFYYSTDSSNLASAFVGELDTHYSLNITTTDAEYNAKTSIPHPSKVIDSVWWKPAPHSNDTGRVLIMVKATDPPGYGDYVRYYTKIDDAPFFPGLNSVFDDYFVDGTTYELQVEPGFDRNLERTESDLFFHRGDSVTLKLSNIDRSTYDFWRTMEYSYSSIGNPFATPVKVLGNISNGALGYFGGYASQYRTLVIPK